MKKLTILMILTLSAACSPKKNSVKTGVATISGVAAGTQCVSMGAQPATATSPSMGYIFDSTSTSYNFENQVKALLSATTDPSSVSTVSPLPNASGGTGVGFTGVIKLDAAGNVVGAQSQIKITVYDGIWYMNQTANNLIILNFDPASTTNPATLSGQFNTQTGDGVLSLKDKYGEVRFQGKIDAQNFSGQVSFQNTTSVIGGSPAIGTLGQFSIQRCAILQ